MVKLHTLESVEAAAGRRLDRFRVPGGWLYRAIEWGAVEAEEAFAGLTPCGVALAFVPDPPRPLAREAEAQWLHETGRETP